MEKRIMTIGLVALLILLVLFDALFFLGYYGAARPGEKTVVEQSMNAPPETPQRLDVMLFKTDNCTPCEKEEEFLQELLSNYSCCMDLKEYDIGQNGSDMGLFMNLSSSLGFPSSQVPVMVLGNDYYVGFDGEERAGKNIRLIVEQAYARYPKASANTTELLLFWREGCPHCAAEKRDFLPYISDKYPGLDIRLYDVDTEEGISLLMNLSREMDFSPGGVPVTIVRNKYYSDYYIGFGSFDSTGVKLEAMLIKALASAPSGGQLPGNTTTAERAEELPLFGRVDLREVSLPVFTMVLGLVDGFNPCAFFVLCFLLTLLVYARSRKKMLMIGLTFAFVSGFVYFLFMAAWLTFFQVSGSVSIVTIAGGIVAILLGIVNFKEFFFLGKGSVSTTISEKHKKDLFSRMRGLVKSSTMAEMMIGTVILAIAANTYELLCTVGLPMVYTRTLTMHNMEGLGYYIYLLLYNIFYVIPLLVIILVFAWTLGAKKLSKDLGEMLKLVSGLMMLMFGVTLIFSPLSMTDLAYTLVLILSSITIGLSGWKLKSLLSKHKDSKGPGGGEEADRGEEAVGGEGTDEREREGQDKKGGRPPGKKERERPGKKL